MSVVLGISSVTNIVFGLQDITIGNRITLLYISLKLVNMIIDDVNTGTFTLYFEKHFMNLTDYQSYSGNYPILYPWLKRKQFTILLDKT